MRKSCFVLCLSMTASHVTRGPGHSHSKQTPWGRLKPSTAHEKKRRHFPESERELLPGSWEPAQARERGPSCLHHSAQQPRSLFPAFLPIAASSGREGGPCWKVPEKQDCPFLPFYLLPVPGSIYSTMLGERGKGRRAGEWPLNPMTPALCFLDKVLPAPGMLFLPLPDPHKTRAVP